MSHLKTFGSPEKYVQGPNVTAHLGKEMVKLGMKGPVVVVSSGTPLRILGPIWAKALRDAGYTFNDWDLVGYLPSLKLRRLRAMPRVSMPKHWLHLEGGKWLMQSVQHRSTVAAKLCLVLP